MTSAGEGEAGDEIAVVTYQSEGPPQLHPHFVGLEVRDYVEQLAEFRETESVSSRSCSSRLHVVRVLKHKVGES